MNDEYKVARMVLQLSNAIIKNRNRHLKKLELTAEQADSIQYLLSCDGKATCTDLKNHFEITHQTATGIVKRLELKGLVKISPSAEDARCNVIIPTTLAYQICDRIKENGTHTGEKLLDGMNEKDRAEFIRLLSKALENVKNTY